jgi:hypothetical protein
MPPVVGAPPFAVVPPLFVAVLAPPVATVLVPPADFPPGDELDPPEATVDE